MYEIRTSCDELIGKGITLEEAVMNALQNISVEDFVEYCTYCEETTEGIECYSCTELYDMAKEISGRYTTETKKTCHKATKVIWRS